VPYCTNHTHTSGKGNVKHQRKNNRDNFQNNNCVLASLTGLTELLNTVAHVEEDQRYTPAGRLYHQAVSIDGKVYMWGGAGNINPKAVEVFDHCTETWGKYITKGILHPGVYSVACTACEGHLYAYGGTCDDAEHRAVLSKLDVSTLSWSLLSPQDPNGPMRKWECGLVCFRGCMLTCFGGYGIPNNSIQPGSEFIRDEHTQLGWTNELHAFDIRKGSHVVINLFCLLTKISDIYRPAHLVLAQSERD
jgi:hypothetical protein